MLNFQILRLNSLVMALLQTNTIYEFITDFRFVLQRVQKGTLLTPTSYVTHTTVLPNRTWLYSIPLSERPWVQHMLLLQFSSRLRISTNTRAADSCLLALCLPENPAALVDSAFIYYWHHHLAMSLSGPLFHSLWMLFHPSLFNIFHSNL